MEDNMPAAFDKCVKDGGKVVTLKIPKDRYMYVCYDKKGNSHPGEVHTKKKATSVLEDIQNILEKLVERS
jgi:hypothetical protein